MAKKKTATTRTSRRPAAAEPANADGKMLVIVESPAKAKTINRYLGGDYVVTASKGHVRDLPKRDFGIDLANDFTPTYETLVDRGGLMSRLKRLADQAKAVFLATDLDREGEAIAWHLREALELPPTRARRVVFNEITKDAIQRAFKDPHDIDMDKVNAQQARRILDRIVGYQVSPLLWRKIRRGLSAGRVQTVAVRIILDREREIRAFVPEESWTIPIVFNPESARVATEAGRALADLLAGNETTRQQLLAFYEDRRLLEAELVEFAGRKFDPKISLDGTVTFPDGSKQPHHQEGRNPYLEMPIAAVRKYAAYGVVAANAALERRTGGDPLGEDSAVSLLGQAIRDAALALEQAAYRVAAIKTNTRLDRPAGPFTTAALQQAGVNQLHFSASETMRLAQQLYEGVDIPGEGSVGLITYMRTDSMNLSPEAVNAARGFIGDAFGADYVPESPNRYSAAAGAQEAHEAIRPTGVARTPQSLRNVLDDRQWKLYDLIWRRFVACQMLPAEWEITSVEIQADCPNNQTGLLRSSARKLIFDGHLRVTGRRENVEPVLPDGIAEGKQVWPARVDPSQHFTEPPARYTEATLVKALESEGIGRPSTYAAIIDTIQQRGYVEQVDRKFRPTALGEVVTDQLVNAFPDIFTVEFTRFMESELDKIENAHTDWVVILREFYGPFSQRLAKAGDVMTKPVEESPYPCPKCGQKLLYRIGRTGRFIGCSAYPECDYTANVNDKGEPVEPKKVDAVCPNCGKPMQFRTSRIGPFLGCSGYPDCKTTLPCDAEGVPLKVMAPEEVTGVCPDCGGPAKVRFGRGRAFLGCTNYPKCKGVAPIPAGISVRKPKSEAHETGIACEKCGRPMVIRISRRGPFLACTGFPRCRNARNLTPEQLAVHEAGGRVEGGTPPVAPPTDEQAPAPKKARRTKKAAPATSQPGDSDPAATPAQPSEAAQAAAANYTGELAELVKNGCPACGGPLNLRSSRFGPFLGCAAYPRCKQIVKIKGEAVKQARVSLGMSEKPVPKPKPKMTNVTCTKCGEPMVIRQGNSGQFLGCSKYPNCRNTAPLPVELTKSDE